MDVDAAYPDDPKLNLPPQGSMGRVLRIATPLVLASSSHATRLFCDRLMLSHYNHDDFSASLSAGVTTFTLLALFWHTTNYASTFVAQYLGANRQERIGPAIWAGIFTALFGGIILALAALGGRPFFAMIGSTGELLDKQASYFQILCCGSIPILLLQALGAFWSGRGRTWTIAGIEWFTVLINIGANYILIFGHWGFPAMGIAGAGIGTVFAAGCGTLLAFFLFLLPGNRRRFATFPKKLFNQALCLRLWRFGLPNGTHVCLDIAAFNLFVLLIHSLGEAERAACTMAFSLNAIAFIPMLGTGMAASILVGQCVGAKRIDQAKLAVRNSLYLVIAYLVFMLILFVGFPEAIGQLFPLQEIEDPQAAWRLARQFLLFICAFLIFDGIYILYKSAINGAGDTKYSMWVSVVMSWVAFGAPCAIAFSMGAGVFTLWGILVAYVICTSLVFYRRYRQGKWESMQVIEH